MNRRIFLKACAATATALAVPFQWAKHRFEGVISGAWSVNRALTNAEIDAILEGKPPMQLNRSNLIGYWPLERVQTRLKQE